MTPSLGRGFIISAPSSGNGKTVVTLGLLRAFHNLAVNVHGAKSGPDYIDVRFHQAACRSACVNLDAWAMPSKRIKGLAAQSGLLIIEGAMGLFDGAPPDGDGSVADLARLLKLPVVLVVDAARMAQSVTPLVQGFINHDPSLSIAGVILNRVGSDRHETMLRRALASKGIKVFGAVRRSSALEMPSRHLGLIQAREHPDLTKFLDTAADLITSSVDLQGLQRIAASLPADVINISDTPKPDKRIAIASDAAFDFTYQHHFLELAASGWQILPFSPLKNESVPDADLIFLPGGYPELHAQQLASNSTFLDSLRKAAETVAIYGECGGYMALGESLIDANGTEHQMAGLLPLKTSFAERKLHLGYRNLSSKTAPFEGDFKGHEFHYASTLKADGPPLFEARDAEGSSLPAMGLTRGLVSGSFAHLIERACPRETDPLPILP
ncbi:MAG: cobyrinate a,c-diamide synthase [Litoreibacter sp.]